MSSPSDTLARSAAAPITRSQEPPRGAGSGRRTALVVVSFAVSIFFAYLALSKISVEAMWESLKSASYGWLVPCIALTFASGWVRAVRWRWLFQRPDLITGRQSFAAFSIGLAGNNLVPLRGGEVMRVLSLRRMTGLPGFEIGTTILVERLLDVFILALIGLAIWPGLPDVTWIHALGLLCAGLVAACVAFVIAALALRERLPGIVLGLLSRMPRISPARAMSVRDGLQAGVRVLRRPRRLFIALALTALGWLLAGLAGLMLFPAFGLDPATLAPWLMLVANSFALVVPSSPGTIGVYEASIQAALVAFGVSASTALSLALVLHAVNFFPITAVGLAAGWYLRRHPPHPRFSR